MTAASAADLRAVRDTLSGPRVGTYLAVSGGDLDGALALYGWNARMAAALMVPFHFTEVTVRNAAADAIATTYGPDWPRQAAFVAALPEPPRAYNPRRDLLTTRRTNPTTGKVIAELKFAFWVHLFTGRHDGRLWNHRITSAFPHAGATAPRALRARVHADLDEVRRLRNRVAHHEPIFAYDLTRALTSMRELVALRSPATAVWLTTLDDADTLLADHPYPGLLGSRTH